MKVLVAAAAIADSGDWDGHMWSGGGWMWLWGPMMMLSWIAVVGLVAFWATRASQPREGRPGSDRARNILAERFARGELTVEEYRERLRAMD